MFVTTAVGVATANITNNYRPIIRSNRSKCALAFNLTIVPPSICVFVSPSPNAVRERPRGFRKLYNARRNGKEKRRPFWTKVPRGPEGNEMCPVLLIRTYEIRKIVVRRGFFVLFLTTSVMNELTLRSPR